MSNTPNPDIINVEQAMELMHIKSRPTFYEVLKRIKAEYGVDLQHKLHPTARRSYYLRSEIERYMAGGYARHDSQNE